MRDTTLTYWYKHVVFFYIVVHSILVVDFDFFHVCECAVGVDVRDGTAIFLISIVVPVVMGCVVLGRQMNVYFSMIVCPNTTLAAVGMDVR